MKLTKRQRDWVRQWEADIGIPFAEGSDPNATFEDRVAWNTQYVHDLSAAASRLQSRAPK